MRFLPAIVLLLAAAPVWGETLRVPSEYGTINEGLSAAGNAPRWSARLRPAG